MDLSVPMFYEDFNELTGIISAILMSFELALLWGIETTKRKLLPKACQKQGILATRYLRNYHVPVGVLSCSLLISHILLSWKFGKPLDFEFITGYFCTAFLIVSIIFGLLYKRNRKLMNKLHLLFSFAALVPFVLHISD
jgi:hypothetical protein